MTTMTLDCKIWKKCEQVVEEIKQILLNVISTDDGNSNDITRPSALTVSHTVSCTSTMDKVRRGRVGVSYPYFLETKT